MASEVGGTCGTHGRGEKSVQSVECGKLEGKRPPVDRGVDGRMVSEWILEIFWGCGVDSVDSRRKAIHCREQKVLMSLFSR
jgi:hypothetical protein